MDHKKQISYWIESSSEDIISAESIFNNGNYDWSLFIAHLSLEKILKAFFVYKKNEVPPKTHKLDKIALDAGFELTDDQYLFLIKVNEFNLETRYPEYKQNFRKLCNKDFASKYLILIKEFREWVLHQIK